MPGGYFQQLAARYLLSQDQARPAAGAAQLGAVLSGMPQRNASLAEMQAARQSMGAIGDMERARQLQMANVARAGLGDALSRLNLDNPNAAATAITAGVPLTQLEDALGSQFMRGRQQMVAQAVDANDPALAVQRTLALARAPLPQTAIQGNTVVAPYIPPAMQQEVGAGALTPLGEQMAVTQTANQALAGARAIQARAAATASNASAGLSNARTQQLGGAGSSAPSETEAANWARTQAANGMSTQKIRAALGARGYAGVADRLFGRPASPVVGIPAPSAAAQ